MRTLIAILAVIGMCSVGNAQTISNFTGTDTVINTGTVDLTFMLRGYFHTGVFQVINTKLSGTVAGTTYFQGSVDGTNYISLDSLVNTDVTTNTKIFSDVPTRYPYYRFRTTGTGTMSAISSAKAHFKK
jgi:hypothetical protein